MPTIPIRIVVTTCPLARLAAAPKSGIGAVGWIRIIPYRTNDESPRTRFKPGLELLDVLEILIILNRFDNIMYCLQFYYI
jgi:hypothetical protein